MTSFRSKHYPDTRNPLRITQEYAMRYYTGMNVLIMLGVLVKIVSGSYGILLLWGVIIAEAIAFVLGNVLARASLRRRYAQIFFVSEHFSLISVHDILYEQDHQAFPLKLASPHLDPEGDRITLHFNDQIVTLLREDWEDFDLIWDYLYAAQL
ncbi:MAG: hypothetical protein OHK0039_14780 [Bacteroidia bacterium]